MSLLFKMASKRKSYTLEFKLRAIEDVKKGKKKKDVCKDLDIAPSTLSTFLKDAGQIISVKETQKFHSQTKKMRRANNDDLDKAMFLWFKQARAMGTPISGPIIMAKADSLAEKLGINGFKANRGWLFRFKIRRSLVYKSICGESASVTPEMTSEWMHNTLPSLLEKYHADDVYNADETGLFYKCLPNKTYTLKGERASRNHKESKDRLTVLLAANMSGTDKLKPLIIGKSANPRCFRGINVPLPYKSNSKAWMTGEVWTWWVRSLDAIMRMRGRKILLIIDNCPAHPKVDNLSNMEIAYLPANTTSHTQPCDQGIIQALKHKYRMKLLTQFIDAIDNEMQFRTTVLDAITLLKQAWNEVSSTTIANCFRHSGFVHSTSSEADQEVDDMESEAEEYEKVVDRLNTLLPQDTAEDIMDDYVAMDENVPTSAEMTDDELAAVVRNEADLDVSVDNFCQDVDDMEIIKPSQKQVAQAISTIKDYLLFIPDNTAAMTGLKAVESTVQADRERCLKQSKLTDIFTKKQ